MDHNDRDEGFQWPELDEIHGGIFEDKTFDHFRENYPHLAAERDMNKYTFRYPRGESYELLCKRLEPVILAAERQDVPILVIGHRAVLRMLIAYFTDEDP